jgi:ribosome-associated protein
LHWVVTTASTLSESDRARLLRKLAPRINDEGVLLISAEEHRSQLRNVEAARERLVALIVAALHRERPRIDTSVPKSQKRRRLADKRVRSEVKAARSKPAGGDPER